MSETGENGVTPEEPPYFLKVKSRDYNIVNIPFRFKNNPTRKIKCIKGS